MDENNQNSKNDSGAAKPEKRSIRNIPLSRKQTKELVEVEEEMTTGQLPPAPLPPPPLESSVKKVSKAKKVSSDENVSSKKGNKVWWFAVILCLIAIYFVAHYFTRATVTIVGAEETVVLSDTSFNLADESTNPTAPSNAILYQRSSFTISTSTTISATGVQTIQKKATGKIVVYNDSSSSQLLIATTRFQTATGLVYRLNANITVPAKKNVTVNVTADQAGEKYNIGPSNFTLPALKGTAKEKTVYGKSAVAMTGGSIATVPQTSTSDLSAAKATLQARLNQEAALRAASEIPEGYVLLENGFTTSFDTVKQTFDSSSKTATLSQGVNVAVYYLKENSLSSAVATRSSIYTFSTSSINAMIDTVSINAEIDSSKTPAAITLNGTSTVKAAFNSPEIISMISGKSRNEALNIIKSEAGADAAKISIQPFWERKLPKADSIKVIVE